MCVEKPGYFDGDANTRLHLAHETRLLFDRQHRVAVGRGHQHPVGLVSMSPCAGQAPYYPTLHHYPDVLRSGFCPHLRIFGQPD